MTIEQAGLSLMDSRGYEVLDALSHGGLKESDLLPTKHLHLRRREDLLGEAARELPVVIVDHQAELEPFVFELPAQIPSLLSHPG